MGIAIMMRRMDMIIVAIIIFFLPSKMNADNTNEDTMVASTSNRAIPPILNDLNELITVILFYDKLYILRKKEMGCDCPMMTGGRRRHRRSSSAEPKRSRSKGSKMKGGRRRRSSVVGGRRKRRSSRKQKE